MTLKSVVGLLSAGIVVGGLSLALIQRISEPDDPGTVASAEVTAEGESTDRIAALCAEYDRRISALTAENKALQQESEKFHAVLTALERSASPPPRLSAAESQQRAAAVARQRATENLLAAGYSADRIEYLQRRAEELAAKHRREDSERLSKGQRTLDEEKYLGIASAPDFAFTNVSHDRHSGTHLDQAQQARCHGSGGSRDVAGEQAKKVQSMISQWEAWARNLSYGDQRRLEVARALATQPKLILLDEPTAGMNPQETADFTAFVARLREELRRNDGRIRRAGTHRLWKNLRRCEFASCMRCPISKSAWI